MMPAPLSLKIQFISHLQGRRFLLSWRVLNKIWIFSQRVLPEKDGSSLSNCITPQGGNIHTSTAEIKYRTAPLWKKMALVLGVIPHLGGKDRSYLSARRCSCLRDRLILLLSLKMKFNKLLSYRSYDTAFEIKIQKFKRIMIGLFFYKRETHIACGVLNNTKQK